MTAEIINSSNEIIDRFINIDAVNLYLMQERNDPGLAAFVDILKRKGTYEGIAAIVDEYTGDLSERLRKETACAV